MHGLGYERLAQGGDIGAGVATWLARRFPEQIIGAHINYIPGSYRPPLGDGLPPITAEEQAFLDTAVAWSNTEGAYAAEQGTKPQTLAYAIADSPVGLASWITEKFRTWSDCDGDVERVFTMDELLTNISIYWFGHMLDASFRFYKTVYAAQTSPMTTRTVSRVGKLQGWFVMVRDDNNDHPGNPLWAKGWGWSWFDAGKLEKTTTTSFQVSCQGCHTPARNTNWVYTQGYAPLKR